MIAEKSFAYFPITGAHVEIFADAQLLDFCRVGYEPVAEWREFVAGAFVTVIALTFPEAPADKLLRKLDFTALARRLITGKGDRRVKRIA